MNLINQVNLYNYQKASLQKMILLESNIYTDILFSWDISDISINNSSESTQKYLWFKNDGSIGIISDEQNFMIDFL